MHQAQCVVVKSVNDTFMNECLDNSLVGGYVCLGIEFLLQVNVSKQEAETFDFVIDFDLI